MNRTQHFAFFLVEEFTHLAFSCAVEPLRIANLLSGKPLYAWSYGSLDGKTATSSSGTVTLVHHGFEMRPEFDRIFVLSGLNMNRHVSRDLVTALRRARATGVSVGALCSGAYVLAKAGMLDGMKAAIHWEYHDSFMEEFEQVNLVRNVYVDDEKIVTASGGTATADLMLRLIELDHGYDLSVAVSDQMVYNAVRSGSAEQRVSLQSRKGMRNNHLARAIQRMKDTIECPLSGPELAAELGISTRQLERIFGKYLNTTPKKYFMELRLDRARHLLLQTENSVVEVALACGFENAGHFSRVYRSSFGISPSTQTGRLGKC